VGGNAIAASIAAATATEYTRNFTATSFADTGLCSVLGLVYWRRQVSGK